MKLFCLAVLALCLSSMYGAQVSLHAQYLAGIQFSYQVAKAYPQMALASRLHCGDSIFWSFGLAYPAAWLRQDPVTGKLTKDAASVEKLLAQYRQSMISETEARFKASGTVLMDISDPLMLRAWIATSNPAVLYGIYSGDSSAVFEKEAARQSVQFWEQGVRRGMFTQKCRALVSGYPYLPEQFWRVDSVPLTQNPGEGLDWALFMILTSDLPNQGRRE